MTTALWLVFGFVASVGVLGVILDRITYGNRIWWSEDD